MSPRRLVTLTLLTGIIGLSSSVSAAPSTPAPTTNGSGVAGRLLYETSFYSDATYSVQVGYQWGNQCSGDFYQQGQVTQYQINHWEPCE